VAAIENLEFEIGIEMRITTAAMGAAGLALLLGTSALASAEAAAVKPDNAVAAQPAPTDVSAQTRKRRGPTRLRVYPNYSYPGPNAVRQCEAHYEQEFRQAGTVIVPRMHCWWERG
jgi:hypothetical protein